MDENWRRPNQTQGNSNNRGRRRGGGGAQNNNNRNRRNVQKPVTFENTINDAGQGRTNSFNPVNNKRRDFKYDMGYKMLEEIAKSDGRDVVVKLQEKIVAFRNVLDSTDSPDKLVLIMGILAQLNTSTFHENKIKLLMGICNSKLFRSLFIYLMDLPYTDNNRRSRDLYWKNPDEFWSNCVEFFSCVVDLIPSIALKTCHSLIDGATKSCIEGLSSRLGYQLPVPLQDAFTHLRQQLNCTPMPTEVTKDASEAGVNQSSVTPQLDNPPDDFRQLSLVPTRDDLINEVIFLRPNIVKGKYQSVEHYLDVQFRLLREDCFGDLRKGISQYLRNPTLKRYDGIKVYEGVTFCSYHFTDTEVGVLAKFDNKTRAKFNKIKWIYNRKFLYGSLMLLSKNNFVDVIAATIIDRDVNKLKMGMIPLAITGDVHLEINDDRYTMVESEVYFEAYYHVMKTLQDRSFPREIAMVDYIVDVNTNSQRPRYLTDDTKYDIKIRNIVTPVTLSDVDSWPSSDELGFNDKQYEAYKLALTKEFAVIQGPPGTGKTFLGVKMARTLIENKEDIRLLLVCFTNHALDQFLEAIVQFEDKLIRIGGQSRSEVLKKFNLSQQKRYIAKNSLHDENKRMLTIAQSKMKSYQRIIDMLHHGIVSYNDLLTFFPEVQCIEKYYKNDPILQWLFEGMEMVEDLQGLSDTYNIVDDDIHNRHKIENESTSTETEELLHMSFDLYEYKNILLNQTKKNDPGRFYVGSCIKMFQEMKLFVDQSDVVLDINRKKDIRRFTPQERWIIYEQWVKRLIGIINDKFRETLHEYDPLRQAYQETRTALELKILDGIKVVGMTTTGAARHRLLLKNYRPNIVIVEEAAEVLESQIITSMTQHCQHLILIGDHLQLRPSAANYRLAREYNMEVSLFERVIANGVHSCRLNVQHRMRPAISALVAPAIYDDLTDHPTVTQYPAVRGMQHNLFFVTHDHPEMASGTSRLNEKEGDLVLSLANYLMQQDYAPEKITILAAYAGQMFYMKEKRQNYPLLQEVKIVVVDNYQGEESDIVLLSLVRNNNENQIGFLSINNRVCVALSRAKHGLYIFGNMNLLKSNSDLWISIAATLETHGSLGTHLTVHCENHPEHTVQISEPSDFEQSPEGGCLQMCPLNLDCGHGCPKLCHGYDRGHTTTSCIQPCNKIICALDHVCPLKCREPCPPCTVILQKTLLCGHVVDIKCHVDIYDKAFKCYVDVDIKLKKCGHEVKKPCYKAEKDVKCYIQCEARVDSCGHSCRLTCHVDVDPEHLKYRCEQPCAKAKARCSVADGDLGDLGDHQCNRKCYEDCDPCNVQVTKRRSSCAHSDRVACCKDVNEKPCNMNCRRVLPCGHYCKLKCFQPCEGCTQIVEKKADCGHVVKVKCSEEATSVKCTQKCERELECGHKCQGKCNELCDKTKCQAIIAVEIPSPCGHTVNLPCYKYKLHMKGKLAHFNLVFRCTVPCGVVLECGHGCGGPCGRCAGGRLHAPCQEPCGRNKFCGHLCKMPCNKVCPPCNEKCQLKCPHAKCSNPCGKPCTMCKEPCVRGCVHARCTRRCGAPCSVPPCRERCPAPLRCGHPCRGLCGEPCPDICNVCKPDQFPKDFFGDPYDDDEKFIKLEDCGHILDLDTADGIMNTKIEDEIGFPKCPFCKVPIMNTYRYKDLINKLIEKDINPIKVKVFGTQRDRTQKREEVEKKLQEILNKRILHTDIKYKNKLLDKLRIPAKQISLPQLEKHLVIFDVIEILDDIVISESKNIATSSKKYSEFPEYIAEFYVLLYINSDAVSLQQQMDIQKEIKRLRDVVKILEMEATFESDPVALAEVKRVKQQISSWKSYDQDNAALLKTLCTKYKVKITAKEREMIVKAIGLKEGHWFKCRNGHPYCIADCGGAMVESVCVDCGAPVGGSRHRLRDDNSLAPEMDGAAHAAWSDGNNMLNYRFD